MELGQVPISEFDLSLLEPSTAELAAYPHVFRPIDAQRLGFWTYQKQGVAGCGYECDLWSFVVPGSMVAVINRFGAWNSAGSNYTLMVDDVPDPVIADVGEYTFNIVAGLPGPQTLTYKNFFWDVADGIAQRPIRASFLIDPVVIAEGHVVRMYAKTKAAAGEMAAGVAGYFYATRAAVIGR